LLVSLLHPSNFVHHPYNELWRYLEKVLLNQKLFVATLNGHLNWLRARERIDIKINYNRKKLPDIDISLPEGQRSFSFELIGNIHPKSDKKFSIEPIKKGYYHLTAKSSAIKLSLYKTNQE
jgi:hypothetical protein